MRVNPQTAALGGSELKLVLGAEFSDDLSKRAGESSYLFMRAPTHEKGHVVGEGPHHQFFKLQRLQSTPFKSGLDFHI